jgi:predicted DNA-binding protein
MQYNSIMPKRKATSFRLTEEAAKLLAILAEGMGLSQASVLELMIRDWAKKRGMR